MIDDKKICFIICSNKEYYLEECLFYINKLNVPEGYSIDAISICDAKSMTSGYNEGMNATNAKYKVYLHQDVFIVYKDFLNSILDIFNSDNNIGMIGMVGAPKMSIGGVMWHSIREGALYGLFGNNKEYTQYKYSINDGLYEVDVVDGLLIATSEDIPWRDDIFDGWDYYDVSQSFEFRRQGYKVVVPGQIYPWCVHDDGKLNFANYNKYRKICMSEYPEYFNPKRFDVSKSEIAPQNKKLKVVIIAINQFDIVRNTINTIKMFSDLDEGNIIVVDNGSEDGLRHWLKRQQNINYIICGEVIEVYSEILNEVMKQFIDEEDLLILSAGLMVLPESINLLSDALHKKDNIGAVCARIIQSTSEEGKSFGNAIEYAKQNAGLLENKEILGLPYEAVLISNKMLKQLNGFDNHMILPGNTMTDFSFRGIKEEFYYYEIQNAFMYKIPDKQNPYLQIFGSDIDRCIMKNKWEMNYFNQNPNISLMSRVDKKQDEAFNVLEIGCDCGVNLLYLKNKYPNVKLYGAEINPSSASIASHVAQVQVANIEEKTLDYGEVQFDYIIFGDVLEHLRDPKAAIEYCKSLLKENGKILASIPNLMHYSVMRQLINGRFTYTDIGLLDRTHIHLFTFKEISAMFTEAGYDIEYITFTEMRGTTESDREFVNKLLSLSNETKEFMYYAFQYIVCAKKVDNLI